jgi:hypothetical protein
MKRLKIVLRSIASWGLLILALINIINYAQLTQNQWNWFFKVSKGVDDVTRWENRLTKLKSEIPDDSGVIGYISSDSQYIEYYLTQYAIIPHVLLRSTKPKWIIANYNGQPIQQALQKLGIKNYSVNNYGYGLYLIRKK